MGGKGGMTRKGPWAAVPVICILLIFGIYLACVYFFSAPKWIGISKDRKWEAVLLMEKVHRTYYGHLLWKGSKEEGKRSILTLAQYRINGKYKAGEKKEDFIVKRKVTDPNETDFVEFEPSPPKDTDKVEVLVYWRVAGKLHKQLIQLKKWRLPVFLYGL